MGACMGLLADDFLFVGPFEGTLGLDSSEFMKLRIRMQGSFRHLEYELSSCELTYRDDNTTMGVAIALVSGNAMRTIRLVSVLVWEAFDVDERLACLYTYVPMDIGFRDAGHRRPSYTGLALAGHPTHSQRLLALRDNRGRNHVVDPADVGYLEARHQYCLVHTAPEPFRVRDSLTSTLGRFPSYFVRVHRSYAVNALMVSSIGRDDVSLSNGEKVPIPARHAAAVRDLVLSAISDALSKPDPGKDTLGGDAAAGGGRPELRTTAPVKPKRPANPQT